LRAALDNEAQLLGTFGVTPEILIRGGDPVAEILTHTKETPYDLVIIGARLRNRDGRLWRSERTYEVIKAIPPPVLVAISDPPRCGSATASSSTRSSPSSTKATTTSSSPAPPRRAAPCSTTSWAISRRASSTAPAAPSSSPVPQRP